MAESISIQKLSKRYGKSHDFALKNLTLSVQPGEVYGFLGSNGAGKSTTIRLLLNFIQPSSGSAKIMGLDAVKDSVATKRHIGYLAGEIALWPKVTGREVFEYLSKLQQKDNKAYLKELIDRFEAQPNKRIDELSKGNRQKIGIIQALMHQPNVLIMDEPTSGLDPLMQEVFYQTIREASQRGAAVFVSSHNLTEAQRMCDKVGIIKGGRLIHEQVLGKDSTLSAPIFKIVLKTDKHLSKVRSAKALKVIKSEKNIITVQPASSIAEALKVLSDLDISSFTTEQLNLEDEFLEYYGGSQ